MQKCNVRMFIYTITCVVSFPDLWLCELRVVFTFFFSASVQGGMTDLAKIMLFDCKYDVSWQNLHFTKKNFAYKFVIFGLLLLFSSLWMWSLNQWQMFYHVLQTRKKVESKKHASELELHVLVFNVMKVW